MRIDKKKHRVAVCLAAHNGMQWLSGQFDSVLCQCDANVMLHVSVDRSSDGTENWTDAFAGRDSRVTVLVHGKYFGGAAQNFFRLIKEVDASKFDYVALADQDDIWHSDKLARAVSELHASGADGYSSNVTAFWPSGRQILINKAQPQRQRDFLFEAAGPGCTYVMTADLVRALQKDVLLHWDRLQSVGLHDWFIYAWTRANGFRWTIDPRPGMLYRQHAQNQVGANAGARAFWVRARKVWSGWWFGQAALIARLVGMEHDAYGHALQHGRYLWLACHAGQCRRRLRDRCAFVAFCILMCCKKSFSILRK